MAESADMCRVKEHCIQRGLPWDDSLASTSCQEQDYYEDLLRFYRYNYRVRSASNCQGTPSTWGAHFFSRFLLKAARKWDLPQSPCSNSLGCTPLAPVLS